MKLIEKLDTSLLDAINIFSKKLEWSRRLPIYEIHKWWARRYSGVSRIILALLEMEDESLRNIKNPSDFIQQIYYNPPRVSEKRMLDMFCGGGTFALEAIKLGYEVYAIDINPLSTLILESIKLLPQLNINEIKDVIMRAYTKVSNYWITKCIKGHEAIIIHTFLAWKNSLNKLQIKFNKIREGKIKIYYCEKCNIILKSYNELNSCLYCNNEFSNKDIKNIDYYKICPFALEYYCYTCSKREIKSLDENDLTIWNSFKSDNYILKIPLLKETKRLIKKGIKNFGELLTPRQYLTFRTILEEGKKSKYFNLIKLIVSDSLRTCSLLSIYSARYGKVTPAFVIKSYWLPPQPVELNPIAFFIKDSKIYPLGRGNVISCLRKIEKAQKYIFAEDLKLDNLKIFNGASQDILPKIKCKFDLIFTDPPYLDYQIYSELSIFNLALINDLNEKKLKELIEKEIVVRNLKNKIELEKYFKNLEYIFRLAVKKLKKEGKILITFHHYDFNMIYRFLKIFKNLDLYLNAIYPIIGESSGRMIKRRLYLDLLFVLSFEQKDTHFAYTNFIITKYDKLLQSYIPILIELYNKY